MATDLVTVEVWVKVNSDGDYAVGMDEDLCGESFESEIGGNGPARFVKVTLRVPRPAAVELQADVAEEPNVGTLKAV